MGNLCSSPPTPIFINYNNYELKKWIKIADNQQLMFDYKNASRGYYAMAFLKPRKNKYFVSSEELDGIKGIIVRFFVETNKSIEKWNLTDIVTLCAVVLDENFIIKDRQNVYFSEGDLLKEGKKYPLLKMKNAKICFEENNINKRLLYFINTYNNKKKYNKLTIYEYTEKNQSMRVITVAEKNFKRDPTLPPTYEESKKHRSPGENKEVAEEKYLSPPKYVG